LGCRINQKNPTTGEQTFCELSDNHKESDNQLVVGEESDNRSVSCRITRKNPTTGEQTFCELSDNPKNPTTGEQTFCELSDNHEESDNQRANVL
jgi:hypothetical protein